MLRSFKGGSAAGKGGCPKGSPAPRAGFPIRRILAVTGIALATANCSTNPQKFASSGGNGVDPKYGVKASPRLYNEGDVIPKGGGRRFSGKPYVVAGRTYVPREDARGYAREGLASWYGSAFHGRMTANGEVFDRHSIAAAHPTLPLPSYARVTNLANGYSMVVRVNDRGPYHADRLMDVSEGVAEALEFRRKGTARVRVEYVGKASVAGSDDRKLLATLRTDGSAAPVSGRSPVMVADLGSDAASGRGEEPLARTRTPLAFQPSEPSETARAEEAPAPRRERVAPVLVAAATATVAVPAALQPGAPRHGGFRPMPVTVASGKPGSRIALASAAPLEAASHHRGPAGNARNLAAKSPLSNASFSKTAAANVPAGKTLMTKTLVTKTSAAKTIVARAEPSARMAAPQLAGLNPGLKAAGARPTAAGATKLAAATPHPLPAGRLGHGAPTKLAAAPAPTGDARRQMAKLAALPADASRKAASSAASPAKGAPSRRARFAGID